jgi:hypothetical protein
VNQFHSTFGAKTTKESLSAKRNLIHMQGRGERPRVRENAIRIVNTLWHELQKKNLTIVVSLMIRFIHLIVWW